MTDWLTGGNLTPLCPVRTKKKQKVSKSNNSGQTFSNRKDTRWEEAKSSLLGVGIMGYHSCLINRGWNSGLGMWLSYFPCCCDKTPNQDKARKRGLSLPPSRRDSLWWRQGHGIRRPWPQGIPFRKQRGPRPLLFIQSRLSGTVLPTFRWSFPSSDVLIDVPRDFSLS